MAKGDGAVSTRPRFGTSGSALSSARCADFELSICARTFVVLDPSDHAMRAVPKLDE